MTKILLLISLSLLPLITEACGPGTGALGPKGTLQFSMIPPVMYTYSSTDLSHGQISQSFANSLLASDVKNSINEVLQANSIPTNDMTAPIITFTPPDIKIVDGACTAANDGILFDSKVYYTCTAALAKQPFSVDLQVVVTAVQAIYESQWTVLAQQVQDKLTARRNAGFLMDPVITVQ